MIPRRSRPEHIGPAVQIVADAVTSAFGSGMVCTRRYIQLRASRPSTYLVGVRVEVRTANGCVATQHEHAADGGAHVTAQMRELERTRQVGAEVCAWIERPGREPGAIVRETLVHRRLELRDGGPSLAWVEVAPRVELTRASAGNDDEGGDR